MSKTDSQAECNKEFNYLVNKFNLLILQIFLYKVMLKVN